MLLARPMLLRRVADGCRFGEGSRRLGGAVSRLSTTVVNPMLGVPAESAQLDAPAAEEDADAPKRMAKAHYRNLPVSPKKLVVVANLTPGLCVNEAMLQMEFCQKQTAVMVRNCLISAAQNARRHHGIEASNLIVDEAVVGKGSYMKRPDWKSKGRVGIKKRYRSHLLITLREASDAEVQRTRFHGRWREAQKVMQLPWDERVQKLPRYKPLPGYRPA